MEESRPRSAGFRQRLRYAFRERQIYLRSDGRVHFITLRPWLLATLAIVATAVLFWVSFATVNITFKDQIIAAKERRTLQMRVAYEDRLAALQSVVDKINDRLMLDQDTYMARVDDLRELQQELMERHQLLTEVLKRGWGSRPSEAGGTRNDDLSEAPAASDGSTGLATSETPANWREPKEPFRSRAEAAQPLIDLRAEIAALEQGQAAFLDQIEDDRKNQIARMESVLSKLGLKPRKFAIAKPDEDSTGNAGGPFVGLASIASADGETQAQIARIEELFGMIDRLRQAVADMPVARPLHGAHKITSGYGMRRDPLRGALAVHYGIDFRGDKGDVVAAAADGEVVFAGTRSGYGNLVELRHDNGVSTRYAHLNGIDVKVGQTVSRNDPIGRIGSSGRSTGPHLHYEILVFDKPVDPRRFWRAGENVLKAKVE